MKKTLNIDLKISITYKEGQYIPAVIIGDPDNCYPDESTEPEILSIDVSKSNMMSDETESKLKKFIWKELIINDDYFNDQFQDICEMEMEA